MTNKKKLSYFYETHNAFVDACLDFTNMHTQGRKLGDAKKKKIRDDVFKNMSKAHSMVFVDFQNNEIAGFWVRRTELTEFKLFLESLTKKNNT